MAHLCGNSKFIWPLILVSCLFLQISCNLAEFHQVRHFSKSKKDEINFLVVGDWGRGGYFNQSEVADQMGIIGHKLGIDFVISTGDNFYQNGLKGVDDPFFTASFTDIYKAKSLQTPWYIVLGNHDYLGDTSAQLSPQLRKRDKRWICKRNYMLGSGFVDFFFIDTNPLVQKYFDNPKKQKFDWRDVLPREKYISDLKQSLDKELTQSKARWKIVVGHHTIRSIGYHSDTQEAVEHILPILEKHKVDMYMNGHDHCLEHISNKEGTMQFLTSGGGSKAWKNIIHHGMHNDSMHFYHDGQGFMSVTITHKKAKIVFYDVSGQPKHQIKLVEAKQP